jgi:hypothetical protein
MTEEQVGYFPNNFLLKINILFYALKSQKCFIVLLCKAKKTFERALKLESEFGEFFTAVVQVFAALK